MSELLLEVKQVKKYFPVTQGVFITRATGWVKAVDGVSFAVASGETFGLIGESGCGKTTIAKMVLLLETPTSGSILFRGKDVATLSGMGLKEYRTSVQAVFQDPYSSLNPRRRIKDIVSEPLVVAKSLPRGSIKERVLSILEQVGLPATSAELYPHEFSGGQRQRIAVARALASGPRLVVLDEPVSALDLSIRAQLMNLLRDLQERFKLTYLLIAHDLGVVKYMSTVVGVMYLGKIVEYAKSEELYSRGLHPYTKALLSAALPAYPGEHKEEIILPGEVPSPLNPPRGCRLHPRCPEVMPICSQDEPSLQEVAPGHQVACHLMAA